jgi:ribosomal protein S18 acetylase RimI-like enzyme
VLDIGEAHHVDEELIEAFATLVPQLSSSAPPPDAAALQEMIDSPATHVFIARDGKGGPIIGTLTLAIFRIPTGIRAWIEDVIVDRTASRRGCGEALNRHALDIARQAGARTVELTSRPSREAANRLYQRIGFTTRETNVYRYALDD